MTQEKTIVSLTQNARNIRVPGAVWVGLLVAASALLQANFPHDAVIYQTGLVVLALIAKMLDVNMDKITKIVSESDDAGARSSSKTSIENGDNATSKITRLLLG